MTDDQPVFVIGAADVATTALAASLRATGRVAQAAPAAADALARATPGARFVFVGARPRDLDTSRWVDTDLERLLADPRAELQRLCAFVGIDYDQSLLGPIEDVRRGVAPAADSPFASAHTASFPKRLGELDSSLLVSTYQTGRLVIARRQGETLNTHFRSFDKPMGMATAPGRLCLGTRTEVWDMRDMPEAAAKLDPPGSHDACYLPRNRHVTGDIAVHEMAFAQGELWIVATAFSCLATLDADHSFVPRWRPPFVSAIGPGDRCHMNGLAVVDDRPRYVTAIGTTDEPGAWRQHKVGGGVIVDVPSSEVVVTGLSMPHSPRWHAGRLWVLDSGRGELCVVDLEAGRTQTVAQLPGFTRGLSFAGHTAFIGLSQIRESSTFGDLPLTQRLKERVSGVWMVDVRSGAVEGFLRFDDIVQEVFDVALLAGKRFPEVAEPTGDTVASSFSLP